MLSFQKEHQHGGYLNAFGARKGDNPGKKGDKEKKGKGKGEGKDKKQKKGRQRERTAVEEQHLRAHLAQSPRRRRQMCATTVEAKDVGHEIAL